MKNRRLNYLIGLMAVISSLLLSSCEVKIEEDIVKAGPLQLTSSTSEITLNQKLDNNTAVKFIWSTGSNNGSGASISYLLQIDKKGNNFQHPVDYNLGKGIYTQSLSVKALNQLLISQLNCTPNVLVELEARVVTTISTTPSTSEVSPVVDLRVTPYLPVSKTLYLYGSASPKGTDLAIPIPLNPQSDSTVFVYQGKLNIGSLKFLTSVNQLLPSYNKGADNSTIVLRTDANQADNLFDVAKQAIYRVEVHLLDLTTTITEINYPAYGEVYMTGTSTPNGNDLTKSIKLTQSATNPFIFSYQGVMLAGDFKFAVNQNSDGKQDMFEKVDDTHFQVKYSGATSDSRWSIAKKGFYTITLNQADNTIAIYREKLYMVGSATPIGWNIGNAVQLNEDAVDGCIFTYTGPMVIGEFKLPVNRNTDWAQDMYMRLDDTHMYRHIGGQADDKKWSISTAANYTITANLQTLSISIVKQ